jgi:hypothetical protein
MIGKGQAYRAHDFRGRMAIVPEACYAFFADFGGMGQGG